MTADIVHAGFDGLKLTVETDIPPAFRAILAEAKARAIKTQRDVTVTIGGVSLAVRKSGGAAFSAHTGEDGAEWYFLDPENRPANNPGVTMDFRALLLACGGIEAARAHFTECMEAFGIPYLDTQLRMSRIDFAVDILAPWFEPDRAALVLPPGTTSSEYTAPAETETRGKGICVTGLRAGTMPGRQLAIYDKRAEVLQKGKKGWLTIWNATRAEQGLPPMTLDDPNESRVWRFEMRLGSKPLRNRWEIRSWDDLDGMIGDAFTEFMEKLRYTIPTPDSNRARWPTHELWNLVSDVVAHELAGMRSGVVPDDVRDANRDEHIRMLCMQALGLLTSLGAAEGVTGDDFPAFLTRQAARLADLSEDHPIPIDERLDRAAERYRFR